MRLDWQGRAELSQTQGLGQTLQQALRLIALPAPDLAETLAAAAAGNPFLVLRGGRGMAAGIGNGAAAALASGPGLVEHVLSRLPHHLPDPDDRRIALALVEALDERGWLAEPPEAIARARAIPIDRLEAVRLRLQAMDPAGLFARDLGDCLAAQLRAEAALTPVLQRLLDHLDLVADGRLGALARLCGTDAATLEAALADLRRLDPHPGRRFGWVARPPRLPDLLLARGPAGWQVAANPDALPQLRLDRDLWFRLDAAGRAGLRPSWDGARQMVTALGLRQRALLAVGRCIVARQPRVLDEGDTALEALTRRDIAQATGLHESTVGRIVRHAGFGLAGRTLDFARFLGRPCAVDAAGRPVSRYTIAALIRAWQAAPDAGPLNDARIAALLAERGIHLPRRTISRHRALAAEAPARAAVTAPLARVAAGPARASGRPR